MKKATAIRGFSWHLIETFLNENIAVLWVGEYRMFFIFPVGKKTSTRCPKDVLKTSKTSFEDILQMPKRCLKRKSESHLRKISWRHLCKIHCRCVLEEVWKMSYLIYVKDTLKAFTDDLHMSYQKMSGRCLMEDGLQMSYLKISWRCLIRDVIKMFYLVYLKD